MKRAEHWMIFALTAILAGCGGSDGFTPASETSSGGGTTDSGVVVRLGSGTGASFASGTLAIGVGSTQLASGGSTSVTATLVDANNAPYATATNITFTSTCAASGLATLTSPVATSNGAAVSTYQAIGCEGTDTVTATATVGNSTLTATGTVSVAESELGSIQFVSASPTSIALRGTGGAGLQETSTVTFKVLNEAGGPVPNQAVTFALSTGVGGISLTPVSGTTGSDGRISTIVQAGSIAVPVRVIATTNAQGTTISTQSDQLTISTGIPADGWIDLSVDVLNPEAYDINGVTVTATAHLADRFSNPVPDGTVVNFRAEAGSIQSSCTTSDGACSVTWTSQNQERADLYGNPGVATILAYAIGEESFTDNNGNGRFDDNDTFGAGNDLAEAFVDYDFDNTQDSAEPYIDFNENGQFDAVGDALFNGVLCEHTSLCGDTSSVIVSDDIRIVMSTSTAVITFSAVSLNVRGGSGTVTVTVEDMNTNTMPMGTTITVTAPSGVELPGTSTFTVPNAAALAGTPYDIVLNDSDTAVNGTGYLEVRVTAPSGATDTGSILVTY